MVFPGYLAMTASEIAGVTALPPKIGWMACHFSPYGLGLSNRPKRLPPGSLVICNDRTPIHGHDPELVARELLESIEACGGERVLLDFQRPGSGEAAAVAQAVVEHLNYPVGVAASYAGALPCPVFLPPVPLHIPIPEYLAPWDGREIWLDGAPDGEIITITEAGSAYTPLPPGDRPSGGFAEEALHCHYRIETTADRARFTLYRTPDDLLSLLHAARELGVTQSIGLYQELVE